MIIPDIDIFYSSLSDLIKTERIKRGIKQEKMQDVLGLSRGSITNLEKGKHRPSIYQLLKIAELFEIDYVDLIPVKRDNIEIVTDPNLLDKAIFDEVERTQSATESVEKFLSELKGDN